MVFPETTVFFKYFYKNYVAKLTLRNEDCFLCIMVSPGQPSRRTDEPKQKAQEYPVEYWSLQIIFPWIERRPNGQPTATHFGWLRVPQPQQHKTKTKNRSQPGHRNYHSHGAHLHPSLVAGGRPRVLFSPAAAALQPRRLPATRQLQGRGAVSVREVRAEQQAWRQRRRRVGEPPCHDELRRGGRL